MRKVVFRRLLVSTLLGSELKATTGSPTRKRELNGRDRVWGPGPQRWLKLAVQPQNELLRAAAAQKASDCPRHDIGVCHIPNIPAALT